MNVKKGMLALLAIAVLASASTMVKAQESSTQDAPSATDNAKQMNVTGTLTSRLRISKKKIVLTGTSRSRYDSPS